MLTPADTSLPPATLRAVRAPETASTRFGPALRGRSLLECSRTLSGLHAVNDSAPYLERDKLHLGIGTNTASITHLAVTEQAQQGPFEAVRRSDDGG